MGDLVGVVWRPCRTSLLESGLEHMAMPAFDHARADWHAPGQRAWIVQTVQTMAQVAIPVAHRSFCFRDPVGFQMLGQGRDHLLHVATLESLLLGSSPWILQGQPAAWRGRSQVFANVNEVAQKVGLGANTPRLRRRIRSAPSSTA